MLTAVLLVLLPGGQPRLLGAVRQSDITAGRGAGDDRDDRTGETLGRDAAARPARR